MWLLTVVAVISISDNGVNVYFKTTHAIKDRIYVYTVFDAIMKMWSYIEDGLK